MKGVSQFLLLVFCLFVASSSGERTIGELLNGYFRILNYSVYSNGAWVGKYTHNPHGSIVYVPSYPGALVGNMSVCFGEDTQGATPYTPAQVLDGMVAYTGPYQIEPENGRVAHRIILITNPYSALTHVGGDNYRYYSFFDNDNILRLFVDQGADLYWERVNKFPACDVSAQLSSRGNPWFSEGAYYSVFDATISNNGAALTSVNVRIQGTISSSWGLTLISDNLYSVDLYSGLSTGGSVTPGFIAAGTVSVTIVATSC